LLQKIILETPLMIKNRLFKQKAVFCFFSAFCKKTQKMFFSILEKSNSLNPKSNYSIFNLLKSLIILNSSQPKSNYLKGLSY